MLALELNRTLVLPHLLLDGTQQADAAVTEDTGAQHVHFWCGQQRCHCDRSRLGSGGLQRHRGRSIGGSVAWGQEQSWLA